jgi:hypothetical protein
VSGILQRLDTSLGFFCLLPFGFGCVADVALLSGLVAGFAARTLESRARLARVTVLDSAAVGTSLTTAVTFLAFGISSFRQYCDCTSSVLRQGTIIISPNIDFASASSMQIKLHENSLRQYFATSYVYFPLPANRHLPEPTWRQTTADRR